MRAGEYQFKTKCQPFICHYLGSENTPGVRFRLGVIYERLKTNRSFPSF